MSQAKTMKLKEYGTDILAHDPSVTADNRGVRVNGTFTSSIMDQTPVDQEVTLRYAKSRERLVSARPLTAQVMRASYQDSNIFGYKDEGNHTVQRTTQKSSSRVRNNDTFQSRVFSPEKTFDEAARPMSRSRCEEKWSSTVFAGPIIEQATRKKLGRVDAGTANIFGSDQVDLDNKSNTMTIIGRKPQVKKWTPVRKEKTAEQRKNEELYGRTVATYGTNKRGDGTLMASGADWKNLQAKHVNSPLKKQQNNLDKTSKDKKFQNLQSNILSNEDPDSRPPAYVPDSDRVFTTEPKVVNKGFKQDTYKKKQAQLSSQVFDLPEYGEHVPMRKKQPVDVNNRNDNQKKTDHMYSDVFGGGSQASLRASKNFTPSQTTSPKKKMTTATSVNEKKFSQMRSALDTHDYEPSEYVSKAQALQTPEKTAPPMTLNCKSSTAVKVRDLSSDILGVGDALQRFQNADSTKTAVVDLTLKGLSENTQAEDLKKISGVKHVISATIDQDSIRNVCTGTGRVKLRLGPNEDIDMVKLQYLKAGFGVQEHNPNTKLQTKFTTEQTLAAKSPVKGEIDAKSSKVSNLQTNNPEIFGNSSAYQTKYANNVNHQDISSGNKAAQNEHLTISNWTKMGGKA